VVEVHAHETSWKVPPAPSGTCNQRLRLPVTTL
jgi:hypothetical protein